MESQQELHDKDPKYPIMMAFILDLDDLEKHLGRKVVEIGVDRIENGASVGVRYSGSDRKRLKKMMIENGLTPREGY